MIEMNSFGKNFRITSFGESHGKAIGVVIDGCPSGLEISLEEIQKELDKRKPSQSEIATERQEDDKAEILSGIFEGKTTGMPITMLIQNKDPNPGDYENIKDKFRPGHADYTYFKKYGIRDYRGGGRQSGRETAARTAAGAIAKKLLEMEGISIIGHTLQIGDIKAETFNEEEIRKNPLKCADPEKAKEMLELVKEAQGKGNSIGGILQIEAKNPPAGLGNPVFGKLDAKIAYAIMGIPAVKGIEFGAGFKLACLTGKEANDEMDSKGFLSNNAGGILGGISTGEDIVFRAVIKPASSISLKQKTVDEKGREKEIKVEGRHDACICPRALPVMESMLALVLIDELIEIKGYEYFTSSPK